VKTEEKGLGLRRCLESEKILERKSEVSIFLGKKMTTGIMQDQNNLEKHIEKQMGCMAGFLQIFDRHQILTAKRLYSTKRLPPSTVSFSFSVFYFMFGSWEKWKEN
jgi:hypothetical protein